jgi:hypothetical protein
MVSQYHAVKEQNISLQEHTLSTLVFLESESEFYVTTDGQLASLSWNKAPIWGL